MAVALGSLAYLALPVGTFLAAWLRPGWALSLVSALLVAMLAWGRRIREAGEPAETPTPPLSTAMLAGAVVGVIALVAISGAGGSGVQTWDWEKHEAILSDLIQQPWPVAYATGRDDVALTYYLAYYLPAAVAGKVAGWTVANVVLLVWTAIGAALALLWLVVLSGAPAGRCLAIFVLFSGLDLAGAAIGSAPWSDRAGMLAFHAEWWAGHWVYPNNVTLLAFAPHQAVAAWLLTGLALDGLRRYRGRYPHLLGAALGLLWSPFAALGLLGLAALDWLSAWRDRGGLPGLARDAAELAGTATGLVLAVYLSSHYRPVILPARYYPPPDRIAAAGLGFVPARMPARQFVADYVVFVLLEFLLLAALLYALRRARQDDRRLLTVATLTLLALPFVTYGYFNDLAMRTSIPALFILQVLTARAVDDAPRRPALVAALALVLVAGALYPANMLRLSAQGVVQRGALVRIRPRARVPDLFQQQLRTHYFFVGQYIGALDGPFFRYLARQPIPVSAADRDGGP
jgi:hypothetical protein